MPRKWGRAMDFSETLRDLYAQKETLERAIASLEEMAWDREPGLAANGAKRRGRKSMGAAERREVSERMKRYWATRKLKPGK
jgi:hypothetical protein